MRTKMPPVTRLGVGMNLTVETSVTLRMLALALPAWSKWERGQAAGNEQPMRISSLGCRSACF